MPRNPSTNLLEIGTRVFCIGYSQWGEYTFKGRIEGYTENYDPYDNGPSKITGYKVRSDTGVLDTVWLRDAEEISNGHF